MKLRKSDYNKILRYYGARIPKTIKNKKNRAETIMAKKMCSCIQKIRTLRIRTQPSRGDPRFAICNNSIFKKRGLKFHRITCKKGAKFIKSKKNGHKLTKSQQTIRF